MKKVFIGKNGKAYSKQDLQEFVIASNKEIIEQFTMQELDAIYQSFDMYFSERTCSDVLLEKIKIYDQSDNINSFIYKQNAYWLDKSARNGLRNLLNANVEYVDLVLDDIIITLNKSDLTDFLNSLEIYANKCYVCTHKHLIEAKKLETKKDIINYDYTTGYPEKVVLE